MPTILHIAQPEALAALAAAGAVAAGAVALRAPGPRLRRAPAPIRIRQEDQR